DAASVESLLHLGERRDLDGKVGRGRVDAVERRLLVLDQVQLSLSQVVPGTGKAEVRTRGGREPEHTLVEVARARDLAHAHGSMMERVAGHGSRPPRASRGRR